MRRLFLILLALVLLTGCDQLFPYDKEPVQVCGGVDSTLVVIGVDSAMATMQVCRTEWRRKDAPPQVPE